jgi:uroporphyrinogen-III synthase
MTERPGGVPGVLVTRPEKQATELVEAIRRRGARPILFPCLEIVPRSRSAVQQDLEELGEADISIFISRNAVTHGIDYASGKLAAIGPTTAAAIAAAGRHADICPAAGFDSEHLLAEPPFLDVAGKTIRIIRGNGGRETLADALRERGAQVDYLATYSRAVPAYPPDRLEKIARQWREGAVAATVVMSIQTLDGLWQLLPATCDDEMPRTALVSPAARVLKAVQNRYPECPVALAKSPSSTDIADCLAGILAAGDQANSPGGTSE